MSPQLSLTAVTLSNQNGQDMNTRSMSNSELAQATATAFSNIQRLDADLPPTSAVDINPLDDRRQISRKRSASGDSDFSRITFPNCSVNFLSAIFDDIAKAQADTITDINFEGTDNPISSSPSYLDSGIIPHKNKKFRSCLSRSLSRCGKSFKNLPAAFTSYSAATVSTEVTQVTDLSSQISPRSGEDPDFEPQSPIPTDHVIVTSHFPDAASIIDQVLSSNIPFPKLPATVSEQSCSPPNNKNVIQTVDNAAQGVGRKKRPLKDCYGWFVETDEDEQLRNRAEAIADASVKTRASPDDLSFSAITALKSVVADDDLEWAKAADTVDDVLGDFF